MHRPAGSPVTYMYSVTLRCSRPAAKGGSLQLLRKAYKYLVPARKWKDVPW